MIRALLILLMVPFLVFAQEEEEAAPQIESTPEEMTSDEGSSEVSDEQAEEPAGNSADDEVEVVLQRRVNDKRYNRRLEDDPSASIEKIHEFLNDDSKTQTGGNQSLEYEFKYFNYGAITKAQKEARKGKYYVVNWKNKGVEDDFVLRLEYRQARTRDKIHVMEIAFDDVKGSQKGTFAVVGKAYKEHGQVLAWRLSLLRDGELVSDRRSFIW